MIDYKIAEYGVENFKVELLEVVPFNKKDEAEKFYIKKYNSIENGYNLTIGRRL